MTTPILYTTDPSPPCRAVLMAATALGVALDFRQVNLQAGEQLTPEFMKMNPLHTIPLLDDNGYYLWDSHAIICYLADKYGNNEAIYPKDLQVRAKIHQMMQFDNGYLFSSMRNIFYGLLSGDPKISNDKIAKLNEAYDSLEKLLEGRTWLVGDSYTLADISIATTISTIQAMRSFDKYPNIKAYLKRCEETLPGYAEKNEPGRKMVLGFIKSVLPDEI